MNGVNFNYLLHHEVTTDVLKTIPDEYLPLLRDVFRTRWPYSVQAWTFVNQMINWKRQNPKTGVRFTAPYGKWQDGTFVAIMTEYNYKIFFFTLEKSCEKLCKALIETKIIEWKKGPYICAIHADQDEKVMETLRKVDGEIDNELESTCFWLPKETAIKFEIKIPDNFTILPLTPNDSHYINSMWEFQFPESQKHLANIISRNGGNGIVTSSSPPVLASWVSTADYGTIGLLHTLPEFKRKGLAGILVKIQAKKSAQNNLDSIAYISRINIASQTLFKSVGFILNNNIRWVQFKLLENRMISEKLSTNI